jgi:hypothetical protein
MRVALILAAALSLSVLSACVVPVAPGYNIDREKIEVHEVAQSPPYLLVRAEYGLHNAGNQPLSYILADVPGANHYGLRDLKVEWDSQPAQTREEAPEDAMSNFQASVRVEFIAPWPVRQRGNLVFEYKLAGSGTSHHIAVGNAAFYLPEAGWLPVVQEPKKLFAPGGERPNPTTAIFYVPDGFRVHSGGSPAKALHQNGEIGWRYVLKRDDPDPFATAGKYVEETVEDANARVTFWTFQPLPTDAVNATGRRIAATLAAYTKAFGALSAAPLKVWIAQAEADLDTSRWFLDPTFATTLPDCVVLNHAAFDAGVQSDEFMDSVVRGLAEMWLGNRVQVRPEARLVLQGGFARYATVVAAEASGGESARTGEVTRLVETYNRALGSATEKPLMSVGPNDTPEQRAIARAKAPLFFIALEDTYGEVPVRQAIRELVELLGNSSVGFSELRSALEATTGKNLADFFRTWLNQPGIPPEFEKRYAR